MPTFMSATGGNVLIRCVSVGTLRRITFGFGLEEGMTVRAISRLLVSGATSMAFTADASRLLARRPMTFAGFWDEGLFSKYAVGFGWGYLRLAAKPRHSLTNSSNNPSCKPAGSVCISG